jgi:YHS domain-containing protein
MNRSIVPFMLALLMCLCMGNRLAFAGGDHDDHGHDDHGHGSHAEDSHDDHGHDDHGHDDHGHDHGKVAVKSAPYPLNTCLVSGNKLDAKAVSYDHKGRALKFGSSKSLDTFKADPRKYLTQLDKAIVKLEGPKYPLTVDVVTGAKLGEKPINYVYKNHLVRFASMDSIDKFEADPAKYLKKIADARKKKS